MEKKLQAVELDLLERIREGDDPEAKERFFARYEDPLSFFIGSPDPAFEEVERNLVMEKALASLPPRHRRVMELRLKKCFTQTRIARELSISQMHVSRLIREAVGMLHAMCCVREEPA